MQKRDIQTDVSFFRLRKLPLQLVRPVCIVQRRLPGDFSFLKQLCNGLIHGDHSLPAAGGDGIVQLVILLSRIMLRTAPVI